MESKGLGGTSPSNPHSGNDIIHTLQTMGKFVTFPLVILNSKIRYKFLNSSVDKLRGNVAAKSNAFNHLKEYYLEKLAKIRPLAVLLLGFCFGLRPKLSNVCLNKSKMYFTRWGFFEVTAILS